MESLSLRDMGENLKTQEEYIQSCSQLWINIERRFISSGYINLEHKDSVFPSFLKSLLFTLTHFHNESINIYTHLIPFIYVILHLIAYIINAIAIEYGFINNNNNNNDDTYTLSQTLVHYYGISMGICFITSVYYHTGCCLYPSHYTHLLKIDVFGVFSLIFGSTFISIFIGFSCHTFLRYMYIALDIIIFICLLFPLLFVWPSKTSFKCKAFVMFFAIALQMLPIFHWIYICFMTDMETLIFFYYAFIEMLGCYLIGFIIWYYHIPECLYPGKFDMVGNSHQIWHIFVVIASFSWWYAITDLAKWYEAKQCI